ncbi:hypothetical protein TNCV_560121 [Trichonephila clavipes]|nr:hypothetical protein TNCV_560121 [Trichonephila clavipes]
MSIAEPLAADASVASDFAALSACSLPSVIPPTMTSGSQQNTISKPLAVQSTRNVEYCTAPTGWQRSW